MISHPAIALLLIVLAVVVTVLAALHGRGRFSSRIKEDGNWPLRYQGAVRPVDLYGSASHSSGAARG